jgi:hypothetical protein
MVIVGVQKTRQQPSSFLVEKEKPGSGDQAVAQRGARLGLGKPITGAG